jgi:hypothetical protein
MPCYLIAGYLPSVFPPIPLTPLSLKILCFVHPDGKFGLIVKLTYI